MPTEQEIAYTAYLTGDLNTSKTLCEQLLAKDKNNHVIGQLLPIVLFKLGEITEALNKMQAIVDATPNQAESHYSLSLIQLWLGDFANGWRSYEWRLAIKSFNIPKLSKPRWRGEAIDNKKIVILCEQGFGDCIQFFRYIRLVKQRCKYLILACYAPLTPLFADAPFIDELIETVDATTEYDCYTSIASLPSIFSANESNIPAAYSLQYRTASTTAWNNHINSQLFNIGIAWSGRTTHENDQFRSLTLDFFLPLIADANTRLVTLQSHKTLNLPENSGVIPLGQQINNFADTANIIDCVDLVISIDTSIAHLSLSMNKKTIVLLSKPREWRWVAYNNICPWYPKAILLGQKQVGDWGSISKDMIAVVQAHKANSL